MTIINRFQASLTLSFFSTELSKPPPHPPPPQKKTSTREEKIVVVWIPNIVSFIANTAQSRRHILQKSSFKCYSYIFSFIISLTLHLRSISSCLIHMWCKTSHTPTLDAVNLFKIVAKSPVVYRGDLKTRCKNRIKIGSLYGLYYTSYPMAHRF